MKMIKRITRELMDFLKIFVCFSILLCLLPFLIMGFVWGAIRYAFRVGQEKSVRFVHSLAQFDDSQNP